MAIISIVSLVACAGVFSALAQASTVTPSVLPLSVRNPYMSTWLRNGRDVPWSSWPIFWTGQPVGMSLMASVADSNEVYPLFGRPQDSLSPDDGYKLAYPHFLGSNFDASTTNLTYDIPAPAPSKKPARLVISFLSPITPTSTLRQSIPGSYISVHVDGDFDLDIYMDVNGDWVSGDVNNNIKWFIQSVEFDDTGSLWSWQIEKEAEQKFAEFADHSEWGRLHFTGPAEANYEAGFARDVRSQFAKRSALSNHRDERFRRINEDEPVFAFHKSLKLGSAIESNTSSVLFTLTHIQDEVVQFASARGLTYMRPMWQSWFFSEYSLIMFHYLDFNNAVKLAANYSEQLAKDAYASGGEDYRDIVAVSARQVIGASSFSGTPENPIIFWKEIASNGNTQTIDVLFPAHPFFLYTNPRWLAYLLEPLLEHQLSGQYPNKYSMHDLGPHFPNLTGHADGNDEYMPVEECGDMLIMGLALVNSLTYGVAEKAQSIWSSLGGKPTASEKPSSYPFPVQLSKDETGMFGLDTQWGGDVSGKESAKDWLARTYPIWKQWTEYLIDQTLFPPNQLCTDDFAGWLPLQTNLALKGMVGIRAMSELASVAGHHGEAKYYKNISEVYVDQWQDYGISRDGSHAKLAYDWYGSWTTLYSLYADAALCFHPQSADDSLMHDHRSSLSSFYHQNKQKPLQDSHFSNKSSSPNLLPSQLYLNQSQHYGLVMQKFGLPLDSRHLYTKSDWQQQAAAVATGSIRREINARMVKWLNEAEPQLPFVDLYETEGVGDFAAGNRWGGRAVVGSHFSRLVVERACEGRALAGLEFLEDL